VFNFSKTLFCADICRGSILLGICHKDTRTWSTLTVMLHLGIGVVATENLKCSD